MIDVSRNEVPFEPFDSVGLGIRKLIESVNLYPDPICSELCSLLAESNGVHSDNIFVDSGSANALLSILRVLNVTSKGLNRVIYSWPNFEAYPLCAAALGLKSFAVDLTQVGDQNLNLILSEAKSSDVVMMCNPHNPTGQFIPDLELYDLLQQIPKDVSVIIDEAYIDFVSSGHKSTVHLWINDFPNLLVVRSFSKAFGLAGLRIGYVIGNSRVIEEIKKLTMPFNVGSIPQQAALVALQNKEEVIGRVKYIIDERDNLEKEVTDLGFSVYPGKGNFIWISHGDESDEIAQFLLEKDIKVKFFSGYGVRLTVSTREINNRVLELLKQYKVEQCI